jgi:hypothetical protein
LPSATATATAPSARRRPAVIVLSIAFAYLALLAVVFWRVWWQGKLIGWDCLLEYWPDLVFQLDSLRHGSLPTWNPHSLGGYSFAGDVQAGTFAPVNWLCWLVGGVAGATPWLIQLKVTINLLVGLGGMHALVWSRTRSHTAAAVAAVTFVLGSPLLVHKGGAFLWPILYLPWGVLAVAACHARPSLRRGAWLGVALWAIGSAGHPQAFFFGLLTLGGYGLFLATSTVGWRGLPGELRRLGPALVVALGLGLLLLAATYVPALDAVQASPRAHRTLAWVLGNGLPIKSLVELLVPDVDRHWQYDVYMGPLAILAAGFAIALARPGRERRERVFWLALAVIALHLALGHAGALALLARYVPGFDLFRIPYRYKVLAALAAAILIGDVIAAIERGETPAWATRAWLAAGAALLAASAIIAWRPVAWLAGGATLAVCGLVLARPHRRRWLVLVPALVVVDLWHAGRDMLANLDPVPDPDRDLPALAQMPGTDRDWRYRVGDIELPEGGGIPYHAAFVHERREFSGYSNPVALARQIELDDLSKQSALVLTHMNVRWFIGRQAPRGAVVRADTPTGARVREYLTPAPAVRLYPRADVVDAEAVLFRLRTVEPSALGAALVEPDDHPPPLPASTFAPVDGRVTAFAHARVAVEIDAPAAGILVSNEAWFPGWTATVDGAPTRVFRVNYLLRAVVVPAGHHEVVFRFAPRGYPWVLYAFVAGLMAALGLLALRHPRLDAARPPPD